jgi:hypothetical protein
VGISAEDRLVIEGLEAKENFYRFAIEETGELDPALVETVERMQAQLPEDDQPATVEMGEPLDSFRPLTQEELAEMYRWVQPAVAIPVHGEPQHMQANAELSQAQGVPAQMTGLNGDLFMLAPRRGIRRAAVRVGRLGLDQKKLVGIG